MGVRWAAMLLCLLVVFAARADANEKWELRGITSAQFIVELSKPSKVCGLDEAALENALKLPVRAYTRIKEQERIGGIFIELYVGSLTVTLERGDGLGCAHHVAIQVTWLGQARLANAPISDGLHEVRLWRKSTLALSPRNDSVRQVTSIVEDMARKLASDWQEANK